MKYKILVNLSKAETGHMWPVGAEVDEKELKAGGANVAACLEHGLIEEITNGKVSTK